MKYISTRNKNKAVSGSEAIVQGISPEGGLFVPGEFPQIAEAEFLHFCALDYAGRAAFICAKFLPELIYCQGDGGVDNVVNTTVPLTIFCEKAYALFEDSDPAPLVKVDGNMYLLELWHGPTHAFKDIALTLMPYLLTGSKAVLQGQRSGNGDETEGSGVRGQGSGNEGTGIRAQGTGEDDMLHPLSVPCALCPDTSDTSPEPRVPSPDYSLDTLILVATSGDTGKAALEGFKDVPGVRVIVLYPEDGVSDLQKLQMQTARGGNVKVFGIKGNFDDAQNAVKAIFADADVAAELASYGVALSSANSINFGRLLPQIVYYFSAYADLFNGGQIAMGDKINFCVPTGNFGNILAGYYALRMGLPVNKLICASNRNNVLTDFIRGGQYCANREFYRTASPSMDILISSNLERLVFELSGRDDVLTAERMAALKKSGRYDITPDELSELGKIFWGGYADEETCRTALSDAFDEYGYIADPHTSVALAVYAEYLAENPEDSGTKTVILSTASPYKFVKDVLVALGEDPLPSEQKNLKLLEEITALPIPDALSELFSLKKRHIGVLEKREVRAAVLEYVKNE
ncbi:MAG: threonine synthase [Firmicutes bacterium]|nr:threonine synthase [Bacillota bacterium]